MLLNINGYRTFIIGIGIMLLCGLCETLVKSNFPKHIIEEHQDYIETIPANISCSKCNRCFNNYRQRISNIRALINHALHKHEQAVEDGSFFVVQALGEVSV